MTLSEMRAMLSAADLRLTKSLGQNFLHDANQLRRIVAAAELKPSDSVLEIGPGLGPLTELLLEAGVHVLAIEKDRRLFDLLRHRLGSPPRLELIQADALDFLRHNGRSWAGWKLVANLPYSVASPLLVELASASDPPDLLVATLQWEVAHRIQAVAGTPDYGLLTLLLQLRYEPRGSFKIPAGCFHPPPKVDSACLSLVRRSRPLLVPPATTTFIRLVKRGFSQRRKMLGKLLRSDWPEPALAAALASAGINPQARAETVTLEQFVAVARRLTFGPDHCAEPS